MLRTRATIQLLWNKKQQAASAVMMQHHHHMRGSIYKGRAFSTSTSDMITRKRSLALSVSFHHPNLTKDNNEYEILTRASCFLLCVDPPNDPPLSKSKYSHLDDAEKETKLTKLKQDYLLRPAGGSHGRDVKDLSWLEFLPPNFRPLVHVLSSSHVLEPWKWPQYYKQEWLSEITVENCKYDLEIYDYDESSTTTTSTTTACLGRFPLNPYPIHHPEERDVGMIHLKNEEEALEKMLKLGVQTWHIKNVEKSPYQPNDQVYFDGFEILEDTRNDSSNQKDSERLTRKNSSNLEEATVVVEKKGGEEEKDNVEEEEDTRIFVPYNSDGRLIGASPDRFLARTGQPLPEGLCGGPVYYEDDEKSDDNEVGSTTIFSTNTENANYLCGIVEGIVPVNHENKRLAGSAAFLPAPILLQFVDYAERTMLEKIVPTDLFQKMVNLKEGENDGGTYEPNQSIIDTDLPQEIREQMMMKKQKKQEEGTTSTTATSEEDTDDHTDDDDEETTSTTTKEKKKLRSTGDFRSDVDRELSYIVESLHKSHTPEEVDAILATVRREREEVKKLLESGEVDDGDIDEAVKLVHAKTMEAREQILQTKEGQDLLKQKVAKEEKQQEEAK